MQMFILKILDIPEFSYVPVLCLWQNYTGQLLQQFSCPGTVFQEIFKTLHIFYPGTKSAKTRLQ